MIYYVREPDGQFRPVPEELKKGEIFSSAAEAAPAIAKKILGKVEKFVVLYLDNANHLIRASILSEGMEDQTAVYPRNIVREMLRLGATGIIVGHNHPTGLTKPSPADMEITQKIKACLEVFEYRFLDHIVIGSPTTYFSFREGGLIG